MKVVILGAKNPETGRMIRAIEADQGRRNLNDQTEERHQFVGFIDNNYRDMPSTFCGLPIFGGFDVLDQLVADGCKFINTITGSMLARYETSVAIRDAGGKFVNFIHPTVNVEINIGSGNYIQDVVTIQAGVEMGDNSSIHIGALISHEVSIGNSTFVGPNACICGEVAIGDGVYIGASATIAPRVKIGNWSTVGAGAIVVRDVPERAVVVGNPAKILKYVDVSYVDGRIHAL